MSAEKPPSVVEPAHPAIRVALGVREGLRRLGVPAERIFLAVQHETGMGSVRRVSVEARPTCGKGAVEVSAGEVLDVPAGGIVAAWRDAAAWWNDPATPEASLQVVLNESLTHVDTVALVIEVQKRRWG